MCNKESFINIQSWLKEVERHGGEDVQVMVLANKSDLGANEVEVSEAEIKQFEEETKLKVIKTSAKSGLNVDDSFVDITKKLMIKKNNSGGSADDKRKAMGLKKLRDGVDSTPGGSSNASSSCC